MRKSLRKPGNRGRAEKNRILPIAGTFIFRDFALRLVLKAEVH
jgi:hypothetical protein